MKDPPFQTRSAWPPIRWKRASRLHDAVMKRTFSPTLAFMAFSSVSDPGVPLNTMCDGTRPFIT